jgi:hypothetical protein
MTSTAASQGTGSEYSVPGSGYSVPGSGSGSGSGSGEAMLADGSWLAGLAMGDSSRTLSPSVLQSALISWATLSLTLSMLYL